MSITLEPKQFIVVRGKLGDTVQSFIFSRDIAASYPAINFIFICHKRYFDGLQLLDRPPNLYLKKFFTFYHLATILLYLAFFSGKASRVTIMWAPGDKVDRLLGIGRLEPVNHGSSVGKYLSNNKDRTPIYAELIAGVANARFPSYQPDAFRGRAHNVGNIIFIAPVADERRRCFPIDLCLSLYEHYVDFFSESKVVFLLSDRDREVCSISQLRSRGLPLVFFKNIPDLTIQLKNHAKVLISTDTGPLHLAIALNIPTISYFGPTQPSKVLPPNKSLHRFFRANGLENQHCENFECNDPICLILAHNPDAAYSDSRRPSSDKCLLVARGIVGKRTKKAPVI